MLMPATSISNSEADCIGVMPLLTKSAGVLPVTTIFSSLVNQWPCLSFFVHNLRFIEILLHVEEDEHCQPAVDGFVCFAAHA